MEDGDDEFGDLYADVEVEASSAMNGAPQFSHLQRLDDGTGKQNSDKDDRASDVVDDDVDDEDEDDDEDDLDIVLNSDDDGIRHGEGITVSRNNANFGRRDLEDVGDDDFGTEEFAGGKAICNSNSHHKYLKSQSASCGNDLNGSGCGASAYLSREDDLYCQLMGSRSTRHQSGQRFTLPRSRNILDVNIDIFEHKPWKHPGADITDYFNFGLNEDSWKLYCNQVDEYRHREHVSVDIPNPEPVQITEHKGQAIQVEGSIYERQSSMDVRRRPDRDTDVIQITILDLGQHCSGSAKEESGLLDGSLPEPEASNQGDASGDCDTDQLSFSSASEDESDEGNHRELDIHAPKRSSNQRTSSDPVRRGSKNHEIQQISDASGGPDEANRNAYNTKERTRKDPCTRDSSMLVAESSQAEKIPTNHNKMFENGACVDRRGSYSPERRKSTMSCRQSVKADYHRSKNSKRSDDERELRDNKYHARHANPMHNIKKCHDEHDDKRKSGEHGYHARRYSPAHNSRTRKDFKPKPYHEDDDTYSRRPVDKRKPGYYRYHRSHISPIYDHGVSKHETPHEHDYSFLFSDNEETYERFRGFEPYDEESKLYLKESELPSDYYDKRFSGNQGRDTMARDLRCESYERLGPEMYRSVFRSAEEDEYYGERSRFIEDEETMAKDWCHDESEDTDFFSSHDFGLKNSRYPSYSNCKKDAQWKENRDNLQFSNKDEDLDYFLDRVYYDDIQGEKFRSITCTGNERDDLEYRHVAYTRWEFRGPGRKKRRFASPSTETNNHNRDDHSFASRSSEESYINNGRRGGNMMPRNALYRRREAYRVKHTERFSYDDSFGGYSEPFDTEDRLDMGRTQHQQQSEFQWKKDEIMLRHEDADRAPLSFKNLSRRKTFVSEKPDHVESINDPRVEGHRYNKFDGTSTVTHGGSYAWVFKGGLDSHLVDDSDHAAGGRYKGSRTSRESGKPPSPRCRSSLGSRLVGRDGKFSEIQDTGNDEALDIEEGQILAKEDNIGEQVNDANKLHNQKGKTVVDNSRILEAMAKMEKRRARFNDSVSANEKNSDSLTKYTALDTKHETDSSKQQRPARKRRWGGI